MENNTPAKIGSGIWIDPRTVFGKNVTIGHASCIGYPDEGETQLTIMDDVKIGAYCVISMGATLEKKVELEHYCRVDSESTIGEKTKLLYGARVHWKVKVGKNCIIGGNCVDRTIIGDNVRHFGRLIHKQRERNTNWHDTQEPSPIIGDGVLIGANAIVVGGITIGKNSIIAAGELVTKDIPPNSIFQHNTCKPQPDS